MEVLTRFSHKYHPDGLIIILLSQGYVLGQLLGVDKVNITNIPRSEKGMKRLQLSGCHSWVNQRSVISSWPPPTYDTWIIWCHSFLWLSLNCLSILLMVTVVPLWKIPFPRLGKLLSEQLDLSKDIQNTSEKDEMYLWISVTNQRKFR